MSTAPLTDARLRAVTRFVDAASDVLDAYEPGGFVWIHDDIELAASGVAATVPAEDALACLGAIEHDDDVEAAGTGPLAVGALPFDPTAVHTLVVPRRVVGRLPDGRSWVTHIGPPTAVPALDDTPAVPDPRPAAIVPRTDRDAWRSMVVRALDEITSGSVEKVVLSRQVDVDADAPFDVRAVLGRLRRQQPGCFVYAAGGFVGATPELLVRRRGHIAESRPMAGTAPGSDDDARAWLSASEKDAREHELVARAIAETLGGWCDELVVPDGPEVVRFASVSHLATPVRGTLRDPLPDAHTLASALHPTPAVAGTPTDAALRAIAALEHDDRGRYAGPVGWMDARGDGDWGIALRCATIEGTHATLAAGAGIVAGSDPDAEWDETEAKLVPMLDALAVTPRSA